MRPKISAQFKNLKREIDRNLNLLGKISPTLSQINRRLLAELIFLRIYIAWEYFLENSFIIYMLGGKSATNRQLKKYVNPPNWEKAFDMVIGTHGQPPRWGADFVVQKSRLFFEENNPFVQAIPLYKRYLDEMNTIRNAIAHKSRFSQEKFKNLMKLKLPQIYTKIKNPGQFLLMNVPSIQPLQSYLEFYAEIIKDVAKQIAYY